MVRWSVSRPSRGRQAAMRSASAAQRPASGRSPTATTRSARGMSTSRHARSVPGCPSTGPYAVVSPTRSGHGSRQARGSPSTDSLECGSPSTAQSSVTRATSTRSMKRILSSHSTRAGPAPGSVVIHVVVPSSTRCRECSTWPLGLRMRASRDWRGSRPRRCWVVREWSQLSRSGPVTVTTSRCERSTTARPSSRRRCSRIGSPWCRATPASRPSPATAPGRDRSGLLVVGRVGSSTSLMPGGTLAVSTSFHALEGCRHVALELLAHGGHVHDPEQVGLDEAVHPGRGVVLLGSRGPQDAVGLELDLGRFDPAVVELEDAGGVREEQLDLAVLEGAPEAGLHRRRAHLGTVLGVEDPGPALPLEEATPVVRHLDLLAEVRGLDRRVADDARALPASDEPGEGSQRLRDVLVEVEHAPDRSLIPWTLPRARSSSR